MQKTGDLMGVICPHELYTLDAFKRRLGISESTLRMARRAGLKVSYAHKRAFIYGEDWIAYVRKSNGGPTSTPEDVSNISVEDLNHVGDRHG